MIQLLNRIWVIHQCLGWLFYTRYKTGTMISPLSGFEERFRCSRHRRLPSCGGIGPASGSCGVEEYVRRQPKTLSDVQVRARGMYSAEKIIVTVGSPSLCVTPQQYFDMLPALTAKLIIVGEVEPRQIF